MARTVQDTLIVAERNLTRLKRNPELWTAFTIQPIMFTLLFAFVFGNAIPVANGTYREFMIAGVFAQTITFASFGVAMSLAHDRSNGAVDRFRALPMANGSYLAGHATANLIRGVVPIVLMSLTGLVIGWRIRNGIGDAVAAYALMAGFGFAMIWIGVLMGSALSSPEAVQGVGFVVIFPVTFIASTFVPAGTLPEPLRTIAQWNPVTTLAESLRELFGNPQTPVLDGSPWSLQHPILYTGIWIVTITVIIAPLATRVFQRSISD